MTELLTLYSAPLVALMHLPPWLGNLIVGLQLALKMGFGGWILARTGRSPLWIFLLLVPVVDLVALWVYAYGVWPAEAIVRAHRAQVLAEPAPEPVPEPATGVPLG
jgi:hypothetical protein